STHPSRPPISPLSLHDALPISRDRRRGAAGGSHPLQHVARLVDDGRAVGREARVITVVRSDLAEAAARDREGGDAGAVLEDDCLDRKSTRLNSSHLVISYAVFC